MNTSDIDLSQIDAELDEIRANVAHGDAQHNPWASQALAVADKLRAILDDGDQHVIEFRTDGWTVSHPLSCRSRLFECEVNRAAERTLTEPPLELGRFECDIEDGLLTTGRRIPGSTR